MEFKADKLKRILHEKHMTLQNLADQTGKSKSYWSQVTCGIKKNLTQDTVEVLCNALKIDKEYFYLDDSRLLQDVIPNLPPDIVDFIMNTENVAWLKMNVEAKKNGLSHNTIQKIINALKDISLLMSMSLSGIYQLNKLVIYLIE